MKTITLSLSFLFCSFFTIAQNGDEIATAILCVDDSPVLATDVVNSTPSTIGAPNCGSETDDAFYYNVISTGDNKITISMNTTVAVVTTINYQILRAPNGDKNSLEEVLCSSYNVIVGAPPITEDGGSFEYEITSNVNNGDEFYLRVYKPSGLTGAALLTLFNNTTIEITSEFDATLSTKNTHINKFKLITKKDEIKLFGSDYNNYDIFNIDGKKIMSNIYDEHINSINISQLNKGMFVLKLSNKTKMNTFKIVKR